MELTFLILYMFGRIIMGGYQVWTVCHCESANLAIKFGGSAVLIQSIYFCFTMWKIMKNRFREISNRKLNQVKIRWFTPLNKMELEKLGIKASKDE